MSLILQWRHNERDGVSNHQPHDCLQKKTSKLRVTGLCAGNSPVTGEFPAQRASYAENVSIWWRHHGMRLLSLSGTLLHPCDIHTVTIPKNLNDLCFKHSHCTRAAWYVEWSENICDVRGSTVLIGSNMIALWTSNTTSSRQADPAEGTIVHSTRQLVNRMRVRRNENGVKSCLRSSPPFVRSRSSIWVAIRKTMTTNNR